MAAEPRNVIVIDDDEDGGLGDAAAAPEAQPAAAAVPAAAAPAPPLPGIAEGGRAAGGDAAGMDCIICLDVIGASGPHRPAALRCGYIFGQSCIEEWLGAKSAHSASPSEFSRDQQHLPNT